MLGERQAREQFGRHEGLLTSPAALTALGKAFSDSYCWSPSALEHYRSCPFKFFLAHVLEVDSPADLELQEDFGLRGNLLHDVLADVHRRINDQAGRPTSPCALTKAQFDVLFEQSLLEVWQGRPAASPLEEAWRRIDADLVRRWGGEYLEQHRKYDEGHGPRVAAPRPERFELSFGPSRHQEGVDRTSVAQPLELRRGDGVVRIAGRIDRVDVLDDGAQTLFAVVDYKSGGSKRVLSQMKDEVALQLELYALAVEQLFFPDRAATPAQAAYWFVKETGCQPKATLRFDGANRDDEDQPGGSKAPATIDWNELRQQTIDQVFARVQGVRQGQFPIVSVDDKCTGWCEYRTVCRVNHVRSLEKSWQFPELPPA
jgi:ATP-dependent helicase/DNAse subunit B